MSERAHATSESLHVFTFLLKPDHHEETLLAMCRTSASRVTSSSSSRKTPASSSLCFPFPLISGDGTLRSFSCSAVRAYDSRSIFLALLDG